jgi:bifunctional non-homologous end joining protein LigD
LRLPSAPGIIAAVRMPFEPMLATNRISRPLTGEWVLEPKFDGWRTIVAVCDDVRVWTRAGHELTDRLPELAPLADCCGGATVVLDGELVAGQGRAADFYGLLPRVAAHRRREPLTFVAFDVLAFDGPVIDQPYAQRRALLDRLAVHGPAWCTVPQLHGTVTDGLNACAEHDVEGIVAKRSDSPYRPGERSCDWLKVKTADWRASHAPRRHRR